jgi:GT2 family glycosyltransferase
MVDMATTSAPRLSLVVLSFRRFEATTGPCLATLADALDDSLVSARVQLILVDNGSDDGAAAHCAAYAAVNPSVVYLPESSNLGFGGGMNAGVAAASGDWVCLVNSDTLFPPGALAALLETLARVPDDVAMVGPVTNAAGNGQCLRLPDVPMDRVVGVGAAAMRSPTGLLTPTYRSDFFCIAVRRAAWQQLGGLDPAFGLGYYEDFDFSLRLSKCGYQQVIAEDVFVAHVGSASFAAMGAAQKALMRKNRALLIERHPDARFEPLRAGNAAALRHLLTVATASGWTDALRQRAAWRLAALNQDEPKSPFKRLRWRWGTRDIRRALAGAGVAAQFPEVAPFALTEGRSQ